MSAPLVHAESSARRYGGIASDYEDIHILMDSTKSTFPDNRHRCLTHQSWFTQNILPLIFGHQRVNSAGKTYNVKDIGEQHVTEDFKGRFIPSVQDYLENMTLEPWMNNSFGGAVPNSRKRVPIPEQKSKTIDFKDFNPKEDRKFTPRPPLGGDWLD